MLVSAQINPTVVTGEPASGLPPQLTLAGLKRRIDKQLPKDDELLSEMLLAAFVQSQEPAPLGCGRLLTATPPDSEPPITRTFHVRGRRTAVPDARLITGVTWDGVVLPSYFTTERNGVTVAIECPPSHSATFFTWGGFGPPFSERSPSYEERRERHTVEVTGRFGITPIPADLLEAIYTLAARMFYEREAQYADQVQIVEGGGAAGVVQYYRQLPPRTRLAFASYTLPTGLVGVA